MRWCESWKHVCTLCGCKVFTDKSYLDRVLPITMPGCDMKYTTIRMKDGIRTKIVHPKDAEKLVIAGKARWALDENGIRYIQMLTEDE